jgi:hypothetical protein
MDIERVCWKICSTFDYDEATNPFQWGRMKGDGEPPNLGKFINDLVRKDRWKDMRKWNSEKLTQGDKDFFEESFLSVYEIPFAFGYVIGQMFDIPSPEVQREIDKIKKILRRKALLPYLPKKRREL